MALREDFEHSGTWLFRWRSYLPLIGFVLIFLALRNYTYLHNSETANTVWVAWCFVVSFSGLMIRSYTIGYTPKGTSGRNTRKQVADTLNTTGAYSLVRNPLYLGNFFMGLGIVLFARSGWLMLTYVLVFWLYYERIIFAEEAYLREKFGEEYLIWADSTPVFIPDFHRYKKPDLPFSIRNVLKREYNGFFAVIISMFVLQTSGELIVERRMEFSCCWLTMLFIGLLLWMTLRTLKKRTKMLDVPGR